MTNSVQQISANDATPGAMDLLHRSLPFAAAFLACLTETIAIVLLLKRRELCLDNTIAYTLPLLVLLPGLEGIRTYRRIKAGFAALGQVKSIPPVIWRSLAATVGFAYVSLIFAFVLLVSCLRASGRL